MFLDNKESKEFSLKMIRPTSNSLANDKSNVKNAFVNVSVTFAYSTDLFMFNDLPVKLGNSNTFPLKELLEELSVKGCNLSNTSISYLDSDLKTYIYCGIFPFAGSVTIPYQNEEESEGVPLIHIKSRSIIKKDNLMRMELSEENAEQGDENTQNMFINVKSKRSKERKIGYIIEKVFLWRKLYNGFIDEKGNLVKLTLEEAADKVGISKKSLDDYLIQLRIGKQHGFVFSEHKNDKVGVLRAFVKKHKYEESKGSLANQYNIMNSTNPNITFHGNYSDHTGK